MRITVHNLGVLKEATIDLKPLTVFIGPNNSGKTWLAYALAGVFGEYGAKEYEQAYVEKQVPQLYASLEQAIEQVLNEGSAIIDLQKFAEEYGEIYFNEVAKSARTWMDTFLGTDLARYTTLDIVLSLAATKVQFLKRLFHYSQRSDVGPRDSLLTIRKQAGDNKVFAYTSSETKNTEKRQEPLEEKIPLEEVRERMIRFVLTALQHALYPDIYILPTERTRFINTYVSRERATTEEQERKNLREALGLLSEALAKGLNMLGVSELTRPQRARTWAERSFSSTFSDILSSFGTREQEERRFASESEPRLKQYLMLADMLEKDILAGEVKFSTPEPDPRREFLFQPAQDTELELSVASSMVKGLSPLVLYLRCLAQPGELLIIDEPEMNLHPEAQAKMIEFLAMLVNAGLNVLFTTHSPYITDHLTNLIKASESEDKETICNSFYLKQTDAFIAREKVAVYGFGDGTAKDVLDEEGFINLNTFGEVSDQVSNIYFAL